MHERASVLVDRAANPATNFDAVDQALVRRGRSIAGDRDELDILRRTTSCVVHSRDAQRRLALRFRNGEMRVVGLLVVPR